MLEMSTGKEYLDDLPTVTYDIGGMSTTDNKQKEFKTGARPKIAQKPTGWESNSNGLSARDNKPLKSSIATFPHTFVEIAYSDIELGECCGEGSFGTVYRAKWKSQGNKDVAVKTLSRMDEEVHILSILSHRNIIQFYGACSDMPNYCLVTEYAPYGSLYSFLASPKSENLEFVQLLSWARDVSLGMNYLHEEAPIPVVHRDLKSKNVLICSDFSLKICDFGASRLFDETTVMTITGTYPWMAPELIQGLPTSEACDVYSYGVVLWELLTREVPFKGLQGFQVAWIVVEKQERPLIPTTCPARFGDLMKRCWSKEVRERPSFNDVIVELNQMITDDELERETDSFVRTKADWINEVKSKIKDIRHEESKLEAEKKDVLERDEILKKWAEQLRDELKDKSLFNFQYSKTHESFNCEISGTGEAAADTVKDAINHIMSKSGLPHRSKDGEKLGKKMDSFQSSNGTSPLFGMPLSRQGSSSSMESSRSLSLHSDMTYDMSKMNIDTSPVKFMDSSDCFPFPKSKDKQKSKGCGMNKVKLQKQMSTSSEEYQYEGLKVSRSDSGNDSSLANGINKSTEWESAKGKARVNQTNESLQLESEILPSKHSESAETDGKHDFILPSVSILEQALKHVTPIGSIGTDITVIAQQLSKELLRLSQQESKKASPTLSEGLEHNGRQDWNLPTASCAPCKCQNLTKSPPIIRNLPLHPFAQKPPHKMSPTKLNGHMSFGTEKPFDGVVRRPKPIFKSVKTQTEKSVINSDKYVDASMQTNNQANKGDDVTQSGSHTHVLEKVCADVHQSEASDCIQITLQRLLPQKTTAYLDHKGSDHAGQDCMTGQVFNNSLSQKKKTSLVDRRNKPEENPRRISLPTKFPPNLSSNTRKFGHSPSPDSEQDVPSPRQSSSAKLFMSRADSFEGHKSDIYETDDFTYIICPNKSRLSQF